MNTEHFHYHPDEKSWVILATVAALGFAAFAIVGLVDFLLRWRNERKELKGKWQRLIGKL